MYVPITTADADADVEADAEARDAAGESKWSVICGLVRHYGWIALVLVWDVLVFLLLLVICLVSAYESFSGHASANDSSFYQSLVGLFIDPFPARPSRRVRNRNTTTIV